VATRCGGGDTEVVVAVGDATSGVGDDADMLASDSCSDVSE
jgi:hypothetical protein